MKGIPRFARNYIASTRGSSANRPSWPHLAVILLSLICALSAAAAAGGSRERVVNPAGVGPNRLAIDATLLDGARPLRYSGNSFLGGLEDLRLTDAHGGEIPYVLVPPRSVTEVWYPGRMVSIPSTRKHSGVEIDLGAARDVDAIRVDGLPTPYLKRMRLEASGDRNHWVVVVADGTLFDLPDERLASRKVAFEPGRYRYFRIIWDDRSSAKMPLPSGIFARDAHRVPASPAYFEAAFTRRPSEPGHSRFRIALPASRLPAIALVIGCRESTLLRSASVDEIRIQGSEAAPVRLGEATLRRVESDGATADRLRIPISAPEGPEVEMVVDDGDNPPLELTSVRVELPPLPWIYFESPDGGPVTARWGNSSLSAPHYDLAAKAQSLDSAKIPEARWSFGGVKVVKEKRSRAVRFTGASIDVASFRYTQSIPATSPGLASLLVDAAAMAHSHDLADLRIVDPSGRQVPYLVERRGEPLEIPLAISPREEPRHGVSRYQIALPWDTLPNGARLVITTTNRVFERTVSIRAMRARPGEREPRVLASARWQSAGDSEPPPPLDVPLAIHGVDRLSVEIDEGDNAPIELASARLLLPMVRLRFLHPGEKGLILAYGNPNVAAPRYDLALLAPRLFGEPATEIVPGPERRARGATGETPRGVFWLVIILSAVVLVGLIVKMLSGGMGETDG